MSQQISQHSKISQHPKVVLEKAIEALEEFTQLQASRLELKEDGSLVASKNSRLERVISLARCYIAPLFSDQVRKEQQKKLQELKNAVLRARDHIKSHSALIEKYQKGDEAQRKLAALALVAIERYNAIVAEDALSNSKSDPYNYERHQLLLDGEIKGQQIELPVTYMKSYDSHPHQDSHSHTANKVLNELKDTFFIGAKNKTNSSISSTHKKEMQCMIDTFQIKAIRLIEAHLKKSFAEIVPLVKKSIPEIVEGNNSDQIGMRQLIEVDAGSFILVTGCFQQSAAHSQIISMPLPIADSFRLCFQLTHTGFPYPSQHTGWALADEWIEASPLRLDQTPLFQKINQRRKCLVQRLLTDHSFIQKMDEHFKIKREVFDQNRHFFIPLHCQITQTLQRSNVNHDKSSLSLDSFYQQAMNAPSAFDFLTQIQQQILERFIKQPIKELEGEWLEAESTLLRSGSAQEKFQAAILKFEQIREQLKSDHFSQDYLVQQGCLLGRAFQSVGLQYQSEKMGFKPPLLNDFERKLQACAFQQLLTFLDECEQRIDVCDPEQIKRDLLYAWSKDLQLLESGNEEGFDSVFAIVNELECYFNSRFFQEGIK